jgi:hypothetical protein
MIVSVDAVTPTPVTMALATAYVSNPELIASVLSDLKLASADSSSWIGDVHALDGEERLELIEEMKTVGVARGDRSRVRRLVGRDTGCDFHVTGQELAPGKSEPGSEKTVFDLRAASSAPPDTRVRGRRLQEMSTDSLALALTVVRVLLDAAVILHFHLPLPFTALDELVRCTIA